MKLICAPVATVTHAAFRTLVDRFGGCDEYYSEMINAATFVNGGPFEKYYVIPDPTLPYSEERHRFCGMKEAFASNYQEGKTYTHMEVEAPARFSLMGSLWAPQRPGKIMLSGE